MEIENRFANMMFGLFAILFVLKIFGIIQASWWIVTLPLWFGVALFFAITGGMLIMGATVVLIFGLMLLGAMAVDKLKR